MKNFTKMKSWLLLMMFGLLVAGQSFAQVSISVPPLDLGKVATETATSGPIWMESQTLTITNDGTVDATVSAIFFENSNLYFSVDAGSLPVTLHVGDTYDVEITCDFPSTIADNQVESSDLVVTFDGPTAEAGTVTAKAYTPRDGDVFELAIMQTITAATTDFDAAAAGGKTRNNYDLAGNAKDKVWKFTLAADSKVSLGDNGTGAHYFIFADDIDASNPPMAANALADGETITDFGMFAGSYIVIADFDGSFSRLGEIAVTEMVAPLAAMKTAPIHNEIDISNGDKLMWDYADNGISTMEYRVMLSTDPILDITDPTQILVGWTAAEGAEDEYTLLASDIDHNQVYFWRVDVRNNVGETLDPDDWNFITTLNTPTNLTANGTEVFTDHSIVLTWTPAVTSKSLLKYYVYEDGVKIKETTNTTIDLGVRAYNMPAPLAIAPGYHYTVTAFYDEGESDESNEIVVFVSGYNDITGDITDDVTGTKLAGVVVTLNGTDEFGNALTEVIATADVNGAYAFPGTKYGTYTMHAIVDMYLFAEFNTNMTNPGDLVYDFTLTKMPLADAVAKTAPATGSVNVNVGDMLEWTYGDNSLEYRVLLSTQNVLNPDDHTLVPWTSTNPTNPAYPVASGTDASYTLLPGDVDLNQVYFWRVDVRNLNGETIDNDKWDFTSGLNTVVDLDVDDVNVFTNETFKLTWTNPNVSKSLLGYNVFEDNNFLAYVTTGTEYEISNKAYNMAPGYKYEVSVVYNEGESDKSAPIMVKVSTYGTIGGTVTATTGSATLADVALVINGTDEFGTVVTFNGVSAVDGTYEFGTDGDLPVGTYSLAATKYAYKPYAVTPLTITNAAQNLAHSFTMDDVDAPNQVVKVSPLNDATGSLDGDLLKGEYNDMANVQFTEKYRVLMSTDAILDPSNPDHVLVDWTAVSATGADMYELTAADIIPNQVYFWRVDAMNMNGTTLDMAEWDFISSLRKVTDLAADDAKVFTDQDITLTWSNPNSSKNFIGYNVYQDNVLLNTTAYATSPYTVDAQVYNMGGYVYTVKAVYDEGLSDASNAALVLVSGYGNIDGTITDFITTNPIAGATITLEGKNEFNEAFTIVPASSDATGAYAFANIPVPNAVGYKLNVSAADYIAQDMTGVMFAETATATEDFALVEFPYAATTVTATEQDDDNVLVEWVYAAKAFAKFEIYRENCATGDRVHLGTVMNGSQFLDQTWGGVTGFGTYKWGVEVVYTTNVSDITYSDCLDKNMDAVVDIKVTTETVNAPGPDGTVVVFVNTVPGEVDLPYTVNLGPTGIGSIFPLRKGNYDYTVTLDGFAVITGNVNILQDEAFEWELMELTEPGFALYVTPTGYATWLDPNAVEDVEYLNETFDDQDAFDAWTVVVGGSSADTWYWKADLYAVGDGGAFVNSDAAGSGNNLDEALITPSMDASTAVELFVEFKQYFRSLGSDYANVDVWDGSQWVNVLAQENGNNAIEIITLDVTAYANADFKVRFVYSDGSSWAWYYGVDDVKVYGKAVPSTKEFLKYRVWLDGNFSADVIQAKYQYGDNGEVLVAGQTYLSEVANVYTSGLSPKISYTFTYQPCTAFDGNENMTAVYQGGTANVLVSWDAVADQTIDGVTYQAMGTNIYRDGMMVSFVAAGTTTLLDADLAPATYEYCTEVVYSMDAGVHTWTSCSANCVSDVVVPANIFGDIAGHVYDVIGNSPIEGATVKLTSDTKVYTFTTDADGAYTSDAVVEGTYEYSVEAAGYVSQNRADVVVAYGTTTTEDFYMIETAYPVSNVHAAEIDDNTVKVTWGTQDINSWITYNDGTDVVNNLGTTSDYSIEWINKFNPAQLADYDGAVITRVRFFKNPDYAATSYVVRISQGDDYTEIYAEDITASVTDGWCDIALNTAVPFDATQPLWIAMFNTATGGQYVSPLNAAIDPTNTDCDYYSFNGGDFAHAQGIVGASKAWMLDAFVTNTDGKTVVLGDYPAVETKDYSSSTATIQAKNSVVKSILETERTKDFTVSSANSKSLLGYNIYRMPCDVDAVASEYFIGYTLDVAQFTDNSWGTVDWGMYKWAVEAVYTNNNLAPAAFSAECLDKDMETLVNMTVTTNSGDSPGGTSVTFKNTIETELDDIVSSIPGSGLKTIDPFRKGTYDITVSKAGFETIEVAAVVIHDETDFVWEMIESMIAPMDLYVTPIGYATWTLGGAEFVPVSEDFEGGELPDGWEMTTNSAIGWFFTTDGSSAYLTVPAGDGTYACANDDAANDDGSVDYLITSEMDFTGLAQGELTFSAFSTNQYGQVNTVEISVNGEAWEIIATVDASDAWQTVTVNLADYAGEASVKLAFHGDDTGAWASGFCVDNVTIGEAASKAVGDFLVYHDGDYTASTLEQFYQYGTNETLVPGTTYVAEVAAVYTTGQSPKSSYTWTYMSCDQLSDWNAIVGENVSGTSDVLVKWTDHTLPNTVLYFNNFDAYTSGDFLAVVDADNWTTWTNAPGSAEDPVISDAFAQSPSNAVMVSGSNDPVFSAGDKTSGTYEISYDKYIPAGKAGYFNLQHVTLSEWALEVYFHADLTTKIVAGGQTITDVTYAADTWMHINMVIDLDADWCEVYFDGAKVIEFQWSLKTDGNAGVNQLGCANLYAGAENDETAEFYFDNFSYEMQPASKSAKDVTVFGTNLYRDGEMLAFVASPDTFYMDMDLAPGLYDYCVEKVYSDDGGVHTFTCGTMTCVDDVMVAEECIAPENLIAEDLLGDGYTATLSWGGVMADVEFRHDDGTSTGQLGAGTATMNTVIGSIHTADAELNEMSWYLTSEGGQSSITLYVMGLDANGMPDGTNVLFASEVSTTLEEWNTYTFANPIVATGGFYLCIGSNGFLGIGTDDGTGDPYVFENNTHFYSMDYTAGGFATLESINFPVNLMVRAMGVEGAANSYDFAGSSNVEASDLQYIALDTPVVTEAVGTKGFTGYNVYRGDVMIASGVQEETYADNVGYAGMQCYTVTASFEYCEESAHSNEACVDVAIGVNDLDNQISIYPNPATDYVMVEASSKIRTIKVTNYMGQVVNSIVTVDNVQPRIESSSLSAGV